jgi:hypothetical protein
MLPDVEPHQVEVSGLMSESENEYDDHEPHQQPEDDDDERMVDNSSNNKTSSSKTPPDGAELDGEPKKKYDPKDPMRPRRKKARRACFACQRAHLTCGMSICLPPLALPPRSIMFHRVASPTFYPGWHDTLSTWSLYPAY